MYYDPYLYRYHVVVGILPRNTIGYWYWFGRFVLQSCFYVMVVTASLMQVYSENPSQLYGLFLAIIVIASVFLWLELRQILTSVKRYTE